MASRHNNQSPINNRAKLIYNPNAGAKRRSFPNPYAKGISLEEIKQLLERYQIPVDYFPTKAPGHATELARDAQKEGYKLVIAAGGDGTVGEVANGLVNSSTRLAILPLGSFMNIARMLSVPLELEKAVMIIKIGRSRKIDVGAVVQLGGVELKSPYYFIESCGLGLEAQLHQYFLDFERGDIWAAWKAVKTLFEYYRHSATLNIDDETSRTRAIMISVSNGPYAGAAIPMAPRARLNDNRLTITQFKMSNTEVIRYFIRVMLGRKRGFYHKVITHQARKSVSIETKVPRPVHADARLYGTTPLAIKLVPNALEVITGFQTSDAPITSLKKRTLLDPR